MSVNKHRPHVYVIPEDRRDAQIANGFAQHPGVTTRQIQVVAEAGGWSKTLETFKEEYLPRLQQNQNTHVVMLIDFDGNVAGRRSHFEAEIPEDVRARVFVIGPRETPEALKRALGKGFEAIGRLLADNCDRDLWNTWEHEQLQHNDPERLRLVDSVKPFLFTEN